METWCFSHFDPIRNPGLILHSVDGENYDHVVAESDVRDRRHEDDSGVDDVKDFDFAQTSARAKKSGGFGGKKVSPIWNHFNVSATDPKYAQCLHCDKQISRGSSIPGRMTNTGINSHFRSWHKDIDLYEKPPTPTCPEVVLREV